MRHGPPRPRRNRLERTRGQKLLIVDDNARLLKLLELRFAQLGFEVHTAERVKDAMVSAIVIKPDLIISDLLMPGVDGIEFKKLLNSVADTIAIPFIFLTPDGIVPPDVGWPGSESGPVAAVQKPYVFEDLLVKTEEMLTSRIAREADLARIAHGHPETVSGMRLSDVLQVLAMNRRSCLVTVTCDDESGSVVLRLGKTVDARLGELRGEGVLKKMLRWDGASVSIGEAPEDLVEETVVKDIPTLLAEGIKEDLEPVEPPGRDLEDEEKTFFRRLVSEGLLKELTS